MIQSRAQFPIVYDPGYTISVPGSRSSTRPFDGERYKKVADFLVEKYGSYSYHGVNQPVTHKELEEASVHSLDYLESLNNSEVIAKIIGAPVGLVPNKILQESVLYPMRLATAGTLKALELADTYGWGINIGGGYHHAKKDKGDGFCVYGDIQLAVKKYLEKYPKHTIMIVDLDAHQGNGFGYDLGKDPQVKIFDVYNGLNYPGTQEIVDRSKDIDYNFPLQSDRPRWSPEGSELDYRQDSEYLSLIKKELASAVKAVKPDLILYNAGTDIWEKDPVGGLQVSADDIVKRDELVFRHAFDNKAKIMMVTSGGYSSESAVIIGRSLKNVIDNVVPQ